MITLPDETISINGFNSTFNFDQAGKIEENDPLLKSPLLTHNLLHNFLDLSQLLMEELTHNSWLNAYLLAAGMCQIVDDYLHPDPFRLGKVAKHLSRIQPSWGSFASSVALWIRSMILFGYSNRTHIRQLFRWQIELEKLVQELAEIVVLHPGGISSSVSGQLAASGKLLTAQLGDFHQDLLREVVRLPSCFRSFDEEPEDLKRIVDGFADRWPDRQTPLMVIGVRTSGNYLGPLYAALLRDQGYHNVKFLSIRPGRQLFYSEKSELKTLSQMRGLALIADDPPSTGDTLAQVGEELKRSNIPASSIILLLQLFGSRDTLPAQLQGYPSILLPWDDWKIHERLVPSAVQMDLSCLMHPTISVARVERLPHLDLQLARQHIQAVYQVRLVDRSSNHSWEQRVRVRGVGMGYFGGHSLAVTQRMGEFLPKVYGLVSGLLYQLELPQEGRLNSIEPENEAALAKEMATYVVARNRALAVMEDTSLQLPDRLTAWSAASEIVSQAFGRARRLARIIAVDASIKRLLQVPNPSVIDGSMALTNWFTDNRSEKLSFKKLDFDEKAFGNFELFCYDPVFDLADLAVSCRENNFAELLRRAYENLSGGSVSPERWLLYHWVHLWNLQRIHELVNQWKKPPISSEPLDVQKALAQSMQNYYSEIFFKGLVPNKYGAICAIDIDGVLETYQLGFPSLSPTGAMALRALTLHGFLPVLATGRSLDEVRERCVAYNLSGGVAEYGSVIYNHETGAVRSLLSCEDRTRLDFLGAVLAGIEGVYLDQEYHYSVRAYRLSPAGHRQGLSREMVEVVFSRLEPSMRIQAIQGESQTDFIIAGVNKGNGLRLLAAELRAGFESMEEKQPLAFAIGDSASDLPMLRMAERSFAPSNADMKVRSSGVSILKQPGQLGMAKAVAQLLGHPPGDCPVCRSPSFSTETQILLGILAAQEKGKLGKIGHALWLRTVGTPLY